MGDGAVLEADGFGQFEEVFEEVGFQPLEAWVGYGAEEGESVHYPEEEEGGFSTAGEGGGELGEGDADYFY